MIESQSRVNSWKNTTRHRAAVADHLVSLSQSTNKQPARKSTHLICIFKWADTPIPPHKLAVIASTPDMFLKLPLVLFLSSCFLSICWFMHAWIFLAQAAPLILCALFYFYDCVCCTLCQGLTLMILELDLSLYSNQLYTEARTHMIQFPITSMSLSLSDVLGQPAVSMNGLFPSQVRLKLSAPNSLHLPEPLFPFPLYVSSGCHVFRSPCLSQSHYL